MDLTAVQQQIDKLYADLADLKRQVILQAAVERAGSAEAWQDLKDATREISASWTGPGAVDEVRAQGDK
jgi:hypothetical protein